MRLNKIEAYSRYLEIVERYGQKGTISNDYIQREAESLIVQGCLFEYCGETNAFILVRKDACFRVYYYLNDFDETCDFKGEDFVVEILYRGEAFYPQREVDYLEQCGFLKNLIRDQYSAMYKDLRIDKIVPGVVIDTAKTLDEVEKACLLFNGVFDKYSGDYLSENEYKYLLDGNNILVAKDLSERFLGALHQTVDNRVAWISHVAVCPEARGMGVGKALMGAFIEGKHVDDKSRYMLWVQHQNEPAVRMYQQAGFKYIGKSTLSMVKLK